MRNKEGLVDDLITSIPGEWKFDEQVSQHFDTHVRKVSHCTRKYKRLLSK